MTLPALQTALELLTAKTRECSDALARPGDVVSFPMAKIIALVDEAIGRQDARRLHFIEANRFLAELLQHPDELQPEDLNEYAVFLVQLKRALRNFARPLFGAAEGQDSFKSTAESLRSHDLPQPADGRLAARQAERIDECAESCEVQRVEFLSLAGKVVALMEAKVAGNALFGCALKRAIGRTSIDRYPVVNEYLAG